MAHILVIDDDELVLESITIGLEENGYEVSTAINGEKGLKLIKKNSFDLVITDLIMPVKEGIETILEAKKNNHDLKIIAISGGGRTSGYDYLQMAEKLGANRILQKPFSISQLIMEIDQILK